ncbi:MAG: HlyD family efflux transporter periplasmic adaptor subunit [Pseudomonadota bacterium]
MNTETTVNTNDGKRKRGLLILAVLVIVGILAWTAHWFIYGRHFESTDDAYVSTDIVQITSEIPGTVIALHVDDTQSVQKGQALVELDSADAESAMASAEADLARAVRQVRGLFAQNGQFNAQIAERQAALKRAQNDYNRRVSLAADGAVSGEELAHAQDAITEISASLTAAREQLNATHAQTEGTTIANHPQVLRAAAAVRDAELALHRTKLIAPVAGVVAKRNVQVGQRIAAGTPLFALVAQEDAWVDANFKEVQLEKMRIGQPVELHADLYGTDVVYHGKIAGFAAGSGAAFALLPAQNASGNWIKIVQRIPVRIALDPKELHDHPLRVGLSMSVKVDVADTSGSLVATQVRTTPRPVGISDADNNGAQARIDRIIKANAG